MTTNIDLGPKIYINPAENRRAQWKFAKKYGGMYALYGACISFALVLIISMNPILATYLAGIGGLLGFLITLRNGKDSSKNGLGEYMGTPDDDAVIPSGITCYHPDLGLQGILEGVIGRVREYVSVASKHIEKFTVTKLETKTEQGDEGTKIQLERVVFSVNAYYPMWPVVYLRVLKEEGEEKIEAVINEEIGAAIRNYITGQEYEHTLSDEFKDELLSELADKNIIGDTDGKGSLAKNYGVYIPCNIEDNNIGVRIGNVDPPQELIDVGSERKQRRERGLTLAEEAEREDELRRKFPGVDIKAIKEEILADAGRADLIITRGEAGDFTKGAAVRTSSKRR